MSNPPQRRVRVVPSPAAPPDPDPAVREVADMLRRIQINYEREGSGPGSRFEGEMLETVQARAVIRHLRAHLVEDLRMVVEGAIKNWAVLYPIPANGLARGVEEVLAGKWADVATRMVFEALDAVGDHQVGGDIRG
jgi:hypothetical protein